MLNMLQNNEAIKDIGPLLPLTNNPYLEDMSMAGNSISHSIPKKTPKKARLNARRSILPGERYGYLTVIKEAADTVWGNGEICRRAECLCNCGTIKSVPVRGLWAGSTKSCGCLQLENLELSTKHGFKNHPLYSVWHSIKSRCSNPNNVGYKYYGGRGISVCKEWVNDAKAFCDFALSNGWEKGLFIDRIDVNGDYEPGNIRFVDRGLSARNMRLLSKRNTSGYRGICFVNNRWISGIGFNGKWIYLGYYSTPIEAAKARDEKAIELNAGHVLNFPNVLTDIEINRE